MKKCSLTPLRGMAGIEVVDYRPGNRVDAGGRVWLHPEGEVLSEADRGLGLFLIDCSWRRVDTLLRTVDGEPVRRRLPELKTAYPRVSRTFEDPSTGLASVEALFAAVAILAGEADPELLESYRWRDEFLRLNPALERAGRGPGV